MKPKEYLHLFESGEEHRRQHSLEYSGYSEPWVAYSIDDQLVTYNINGYLITFDTLFDADNYDLSQTLFVANTTTGSTTNTQTIYVYLAQDGFDYNNTLTYGTFNYDYMLMLQKRTETGDTNSAFIEFFHGYTKYFQQPNAPRIIAQGTTNVGLGTPEGMITHCPFNGGYDQCTTWDLSKNEFYMGTIHMRECGGEYMPGEEPPAWNFNPTKNTVEIEQPTEVPDKVINQKIDTQFMAYLPLYVGNKGEQWTLSSSMGGMYLNHENGEDVATITAWTQSDYWIKTGPTISGDADVYNITSTMMTKNDSLNYNIISASSCNRKTTVVIDNEIVGTVNVARGISVSKINGTYETSEFNVRCD